MSDNIGVVEKKYYRDKGLDLQTLCLWICYACCALSGLVPQIILSLIVVVCITIICCRGVSSAVAVWPIMIFYYSVFGTLFGISVYRIFTLLFLVVHFYKTKRPTIQYRVLPPLIVYVLYLIIVVGSHSIKTMIFSFVDIICAIILAGDYLSNENRLKSFFHSYVIVAFLAFLTGLISRNEMTVMQNYSGKLLTISRFTATFEDPNYMGFFYTVAIFSIISLEMYHFAIRVSIVVGLYGIILTSMSMTAIIGNVLLWILFLLIRRRISLKTVVMIILALVVSTSLYKYGTEHPGIRLVGDMSLRIQDKLNSLFLKDFDSFSTGRTSLSEVHFNIFKDSSIIRQLFGGRAVNSYFIDVGPDANFSAHNEYIDMLLNVGIIGWIIMYGYVIINAVKKALFYRSDGDDLSLCGTMMNLAWLYYVATLTVFLDFRYMFAFFT